LALRAKENNMNPRHMHVPVVFPNIQLFHTLGVITLTKLIRSTIHWWDDSGQQQQFLGLLHAKRLADYYMRAPYDLKPLVLHDLIWAITHCDTAVVVQFCEIDEELRVNSFDHEDHSWIGAA
jgi:hypothetical protein